MVNDFALASLNTRCKNDKIAPSRILRLIRGEGEILKETCFIILGII